MLRHDEMLECRAGSVCCCVVWPLAGDAERLFLGSMGLASVVRHRFSQTIPTNGLMLFDKDLDKNYRWNMAGQPSARLTVAINFDSKVYLV